LLFIFRSILIVAAAHPWEVAVTGGRGGIEGGVLALGKHGNMRSACGGGSSGLSHFELRAWAGEAAGAGGGMNDYE
jgi:hypothetical protein